MSDCDRPTTYRETPLVLVDRGGENTPKGQGIILSRETPARPNDGGGFNLPIPTYTPPSKKPVTGLPDVLLCIYKNNP